MAAPRWWLRPPFMAKERRQRVGDDGDVLHRDSEWVKTIDSKGHIENYDWGPVYQAIRTVTNTTYPGYLWHEAVHWAPRQRHWVFLPRKASPVGYSAASDERHCPTVIKLSLVGDAARQVPRSGTAGGRGDTSIV